MNLIEGGRAATSVAPDAPGTFSIGADLIVGVTGASNDINLFNDGDSAALTAVAGRLAAQMSIMKISD